MRFGIPTQGETDLPLFWLCGNIGDPEWSSERDRQTEGWGAYSPTGCARSWCLSDHRRGEGGVQGGWGGGVRTMSLGARD